MMHLLYVRTTEKNGAAGTVFREGYASLDSLREVSGLPAWRVWELIEDLQELDLVSCIWDSRALRAPSSTRAARETAGDLRFLRGTQAALTGEGRSYPPLLEYHRLREQRHWERPGLATGRTRQLQTQTRPRERRQTGRRLEQARQPSRGYHVYRPREQAARRLAYLACAFVLLILVAVVTVLT